MDKYHSEGAVIYISTMGVTAEAIWLGQLCTEVNSSGNWSDWTDIAKY